MIKIRDFFKSNKNKKTAAVLFAILGCCLICFSFFQKDTSEVISSNELPLEARTREIIESVMGKGTTKVMITFENNYTQSNNYDSVYNMSFSGNSKKSENTSKSNEKIAGVMIVCKALRAKEDFLTVKQAVATCLDIPQSKIYIIGGTD